MPRWVEVGLPTEIADQSCKLVEIDRIPIAIFNLEGEFYSIEDNCPHQHLPLADGLVENDCITCPYHGARFNLITGQLLAPPACDNLKTFPTRVVAGRIEIEV